MRNNGVGHLKGEPGRLGIKRCNRDLHQLPARRGRWTRNSSCGQDTRRGVTEAIKEEGGAKGVAEGEAVSQRQAGAGTGARDPQGQGPPI